VLGKCVKESRAASLLAAVETFHQRTRRLYVDGVDVFLCPSGFYKQKFAEWGYPPGKLVHLPNFVDLDFWRPELIPGDRDQDAYIYFGRISREKGLRDVLDAQALWEQGHSQGRLEKPLHLLVAGSGPCEGNMKARIKQLRLTTVEVLGPLNIDGLRQALGRARFSVLASRWYENGPMAALESLAAGIPLVGARIGGIPEMILEGETGFSAPDRSPEELLAAMLRAAGMGPENRLAARAWAQAHASRSDHMERLKEILNRVALSGA
jgi:glycosyltransferase involved in cell wall biosynthesis